MKQINPRLGSLLLTIKNKLGMSSTDLSVKGSISSGYLSQILNSVVMPKPNIVVKAILAFQEQAKLKKININSDLKELEKIMESSYSKEELQKTSFHFMKETEKTFKNEDLIHNSSTFSIREKKKNEEKKKEATEYNRNKIIQHSELYTGNSKEELILWLENYISFLKKL